MIDDNLSVGSYQHPDEFPLDVQDFFAQNEQESIESSASWYRNLINTVFSERDNVRIYVLRKKGRPVSALPLRASKTAIGWRVEALSNYYTSIYAPLVAKGLVAHDLRILIHAIKNDYAPLVSLKLAPMALESTGFAFLQEALRLSGFVSFDFFCFGNWYLDVKDEWPIYFKNRDGAIRSTIKRMSKKFYEAGGELQLVRDGADVERGVSAYSQVYAASWKSAEPFAEFIPGLIRTCAERGWLRLGVARIQDKPVATQLWMVSNGKANIYKLAYDEAYKSYAPGTLLTAMLMEHVMAIDKVNEVDYLIGDDSYKKSWMSHRRERWGIVAYNPTSLGGLLGLSKEILGRAAKPMLSGIKRLAH